MVRHEWDWQPAPRPRRSRRTAFYEDLSAPAAKGWANPRTTKAVKAYNGAVWTIVKGLVAIPLALVLMLAVVAMAMIVGG